MSLPNLPSQWIQWQDSARQAVDDIGKSVLAKPRPHWNGCNMMQVANHRKKTTTKDLVATIILQIHRNFGHQVT